MQVMRKIVWATLVLLSVAEIFWFAMINLSVHLTTAEKTAMNFKLAPFAIFLAFCFFLLSRSMPQTLPAQSVLSSNARVAIFWGVIVMAGLLSYMIISRVRL